MNNPDSFNYITDCYNGGPFQKLRECFKNGREYLPCCKTCFFFKPSEDFLHYGDDGKLDEIENLQIESSFLCTVDCEACVSKSIRTDPERSPLGKGPCNIPLEVFQKLDNDIKENQIKVREFFFCGRGEPLLHPKFTELITHARKYFPDSVYSVHTNGNLNFFPGVLMLDHLTVSIDGAYQESYEKYRRGGKIKMIYKFTRDVLKNRNRRLSSTPFESNRKSLERRVEKSRSVVQWKYILFEHNDSDEEIICAQKKASKMGVDEILFVLTHTWNRSKKYTEVEQVENSPLFHIFSRQKKVFSTVNTDVKNVEQWEKEAMQKGYK
jgi:organic radical activating enzyme